MASQATVPATSLGTRALVGGVPLSRCVLHLDRGLRTNVPLSAGFSVPLVVYTVDQLCPNRGVVFAPSSWALMSSPRSDLPDNNAFVQLGAWAPWCQLDLGRGWRLRWAKRAGSRVYATKPNETVPKFQFFIQILPRFRFYLVEQFKPRKIHALNIH